jgi:hypothetical protein
MSRRNIGLASVAALTMLTATAYAGVIVSPNNSILSATASSQSAAQKITVRNIGSTPMTLGSLLLGGTNASSFVFLSDGCSGVTVASGKNCKASVAYNSAAIPGTIAYGQIDVTDPSGDTLATSYLTGKTRITNTILSGSIDARGLLALKNNSTAANGGYQITYTISGPLVQITEGAKFPSCSQGLDLAPWHSCKLQLLGSGAGSTFNAAVVVTAVPDAGGATVELSIPVLVNLPSVPPS